MVTSAICRKSSNPAMSPATMKGTRATAIASADATVGKTRARVAATASGVAVTLEVTVARDQQHDLAHEECEHRHETGQPAERNHAAIDEGRQGGAEQGGGDRNQHRGRQRPARKRRLQQQIDADERAGADGENLEPVAQVFRIGADGLRVVPELQLRLLQPAIDFAQRRRHVAALDVGDDLEIVRDGFPLDHRA